MNNPNAARGAATAACVVALLTVGTPAHSATPDVQPTPASTYTEVIATQVYDALRDARDRDSGAPSSLRYLPRLRALPPVYRATIKGAVGNGQRMDADGMVTIRAGVGHEFASCLDLDAGVVRTFACSSNDTRAPAQPPRTARAVLSRVHRFSTWMDRRPNLMGWQATQIEMLDWLNRHEFADRLRLAYVDVDADGQPDDQSVGFVLDGTCWRLTVAEHDETGTQYETGMRRCEGQSKRSSASPRTFEA